MARRKTSAGSTISTAATDQFAYPDISQRSIDEIREGYDTRQVEQLAERLGVSSRELIRLLGLAERTFIRKSSNNTSLSPVVSDRLYRIASVVDLASKVLRSPDAARLWLQECNLALGQVRPFDLLDTDAGTQLVRDVLLRIEFDMVS